jgi:hypothetical protein
MNGPQQAPISMTLTFHKGLYLAISLTESNTYKTRKVIIAKKGRSDGSHSTTISMSLCLFRKLSFNKFSTTPFYKSPESLNHRIRPNVKLKDLMLRRSMVHIFSRQDSTISFGLPHNTASHISRRRKH